MKKILLTLAIVFTVSCTAMAQGRDSFFNDWDDVDNNLNRDGLEIPLLPPHGLEYDQPAPLGSGLLLLTALGAGYAVAKRKKE